MSTPASDKRDYDALATTLLQRLGASWNMPAFRAVREELQINIEAAVEAEREECAKLCEVTADFWKHRHGERESVALNCADKIRARGRGQEDA